MQRYVDWELFYFKIISSNFFEHVFFCLESEVILDSEILTLKHVESKTFIKQFQLESLKDAGEKLIREKHFDAKNIKSVLDAVVKRSV